MKYAIISENGFDEHVKLLTKEINRFDIRAEIEEFGNTHYSKSIRQFSPDATIYFGSRPKKYFNKVKGVASICILMPISLNWIDHRFLKKNFDKVITTTPIEFQYLNQKDLSVQYLGNPTVDLLRSLDIQEEEQIDSRPSIALHLGEVYKSTLLKKVSEIVRNQQDWMFTLISQNPKIIKSFKRLENLNVVNQDHYSKVKSSNVAITASEKTAIESLLLNVPQVIIAESRKPYFFRDKISIKESIVKADFANELHDSKEMVDEIAKLISNHEYCATILDRYQKAREEIGMEPFFRRLGKEIVEELESN